MRILTSGTAWVGNEFGSIQTAVEQALDSAEHEVLFVTYVLSTAADSALAKVESALERGVSARIVINQFGGQHPAVQKALTAMLQSYQRLRVFDFRDPSEAYLHAKFVVVDHRIAIVGSANLTWRGFVSNHELAVLIDDRSLVDSVLSAAERMLRSSMVHEVES